MISVAPHFGGESVQVSDSQVCRCILTMAISVGSPRFDWPSIHGIWHTEPCHGEKRPTNHLVVVIMS